MARAKDILQSVFNPNSLLLFFLVGLVFFIPFLRLEWHRSVYSFLFSCIFLLSALSLKHKRKQLLFACALGLILLIWIAFRINLPMLSMASRITQGFFFLYIVISLIRQTARAHHVNLRVIVDSISGYLLIGILYAIASYSLLQVWPNAYQFGGADLPDDMEGLSRMFYFAFVTLTSTGYGDILPVIPSSRSLSTLISVTGQLYIAIIIALLVGKFSSGSSSPEQEGTD